MLIRTNAQAREALRGLSWSLTKPAGNTSDSGYFLSHPRLRSDRNPLTWILESGTGPACHSFARNDSMPVSCGRLSEPLHPTLSSVSADFQALLPLPGVGACQQLRTVLEGLWQPQEISGISPGHFPQQGFAGPVSLSTQRKLGYLPLKVYT